MVVQPEAEMGRFMDEIVITLFVGLIVAVIMLTRDFMIITCVISGLAYVAVAIRGGSRTKLGAKVVAGSLPKSWLIRGIRIRLKILSVAQFIVAVLGCFIIDQGYFFSRWQAVGLLILGSLLWVFALLVRRKVD
jgi:hypothetical protein